MNKAAQYRHYSDESLKQAEIAVISLDKEYWLKIAEAWLKLARSEYANHP
jgi:hypothetical protein